MTAREKSKFSATLNLPKTGFPMHVKPQHEEEILARWEREDLYQRILEARTASPLYRLPDGPPYANGHIHYGHVLNKVLKDMVLKSRSMAGFRTPFIPGWDCHGLPIELAAERALGARRREMSSIAVRAECREYALRFIDTQRTEFRRLGVLGRWQEPYTTMERYYEAAIVRALAGFAARGFLYRGKKPVSWCPSCRTALAEAEVEYKEHASPSIYVAMRLAEDFDVGQLAKELAGRDVVLPIWTTTPWTLPANLAVVLHPEFDYVALLEGDKRAFIVAEKLLDSFTAATGLRGRTVALAKDKLRRLEGARYHHPFIAAPRDERSFRVWFANYVTTDQGTGIVHTAPGHGADDYQTGVAHGLEPYAPVDEAGRFTDDVPQWKGTPVAAANPAIVEELQRRGALLNKPGETVTHQYPHCWRCKKPIVFRATSQWFLRVDHEDLRHKALQQIDQTTWVPPWGHNRIFGMVENRPDWVLSRQRIWGVPIPVYYCGACDEPIVDPEAMERLAEKFEEHGSDWWWTGEPVSLLGRPTCAKCGGSKLVPGQDIVDVWFESGVSWLAVGEQETRDPYDLYLEGADQHRGWFQSSLLTGVGLRGRAPFKGVLTHGFVLDEQGNPYSKSAIEEARRKGKKISYVAPDEVIAKRGAEPLRLWAAATDFRGDISFSENILTRLGQEQHKFRNTCRFLLGNLHDFDPAAPLSSYSLTDFDRYTLAKLDDLTARLRQAYDRYEFHRVYRLLIDYVTIDLSPLYLDVVKDRLYADGADSSSRRAAQAVLYQAARALVTLAAPIMCFTAEDIWAELAKRQGDPDSVHLALFPDGATIDPDSELARTFGTLAGYREAVQKSLEQFRAEKNSTLDARVTVTARPGERELLVQHAQELADLMTVSQVVIAEATAPEPAFQVSRAEGARCLRCWRWFTEPASDGLCPRCAAVVASLPAGDHTA